ncbi:MAG: lipopolysaccharide transport periplasmic protein LptA [Sulfurimonas sp.]|nr:lipopolysaccharide transport periplasmic protein LptA [Sulfurimonas sp.]MDQ7061497.1 lipopolysaccharide transport periplasmic protein LptA [Sulfurimonas sp.]
MKYFIVLSLFLTMNISAEELQVKSESFYADEKKGISIFNGNVNIIKSNDELNASKVTIYTDKDNQPTKFVSEGKSSFKILTQDGVRYQGKSHKVVYYPNKKEYQFYGNVHLIQVGEKKEIIGEEVILNTISGKARAKSSENEPVIMIFNIKEKPKKEIK